MTPEALVNVLEAAMLAAGRALTLEDFLALFIGSTDAPDRNELRTALTQLGENLNGRGIELVEVASGYRLQVREQYSPWLAGLFSERPPRYSRALLETLALIAYRQPITRGEIEDVRGVAVSSNIVKTLMEREWIRVLGHREVPGRPALYGTTREFLDHFGLKSLEGLPPLADIRDLDQVEPDLFAPGPVEHVANATPDEHGDSEGAMPHTEAVPLPEADEPAAGHASDAALGQADELGDDLSDGTGDNDNTQSDTQSVAQRDTQSVAEDAAQENPEQGARRQSGADASLQLGGADVGESPQLDDELADDEHDDGEVAAAVQDDDAPEQVAQERVTQGTPSEGEARQEIPAHGDTRGNT